MFSFNNKHLIQEVFNFVLAISLIFQQTGYAASNSIANDILSPNATAYDFTFNDDANSSIYLKKTYIQVDEVLKEVAKINNMIRSIETAQCNEQGCPLDSLPCEYISTSAVCAEGNLNGVLCTLDSTTQCPSGYTKSTTSCKDGMISCEKNACPTGTNLPSDCNGTYPNEWLKSLYTNELNKCPDQVGYDWWLGVISQKGYTSADQLKPEFCYIAKTNYGVTCGSATYNATTCYGATLQNMTVQQPTTTTTNLTCPSGGTLNADGITCDKTCSYVSSYSCPNGGSLSGSTCVKTCQGAPTYSCPSGTTLNATYKYCYVPGLTIYKSGYVAGAYQLILGRQPDIDGYNWNASKFSTPPTQSNILDFINAGRLNGEKICGRSITAGKQVDISTMYVWYLGRCPDAGGWANWNAGSNFTETAFKNAAASECASVGGCPRPPFLNNSCPSGTVYNSTYSTCTATPTSTTSSYQCNYPATATTVNYDCGYSATCPTGTNLPSNCSGTYPNTWLKDMYTTLLNRCPDQTGYNHWNNYINANGITSQFQLKPTFCTAAARNNEPCGSANPSSKTCYGTTIQNVMLQQPVTKVVPSQCTNIPGFTNIGVTNSGICSSVNTSSISGMNLETAKCEAIVPIACKTNWAYSPALDKCVIDATCPPNSQIEPSLGICVTDVTCPYGDEFACQGDLLTSRCSKWTCDSFEKCGYAYCPVGEPSSVKNTSSTCIDEKCDITKGSDFSNCKNERCPSGFGVFEQSGQCFVRECPTGSFQENNKCYTLGCPKGTTEQGNGTCLVK